METLRKIIVTKSYPTDSRVRREVLSEQVYDKRSQTTNKIVLILESINRHLSTKAHSGGYTVLDNNGTIEHIMPQTLSFEWKEQLGIGWEETYTDYLHTFGNLTLVTQEWNSALSNSSFEAKKIKLIDHALRLNSEYFAQDISIWNSDAIRTRGEFLTKAILELWPELGTPPMVQKTAGTIPKTLMIMSQSFEVFSWRDVLFITARTISELVDDFDNRVVNQMPSYFSRQKFQGACRQLPNGWWLFMNFSAASIKNLCRNLISYAGIDEDEWRVEVEEALASS